jgi:Tol biopolymer transport system component/DNA-binding winged helix-turn-helix (wHTH) protein
VGGRLWNAYDSRIGRGILPETDQQRPTFQFGVFEFDPRSGELRKHGIRLRLQDQPVQILTLLLERPGQVVTREEIQKRLWPENTYVDFDHAINSTVRKLPRFIETLARRGYRFIASVSRGPAAASSIQTLTPTISEKRRVSAANRRILSIVIPAAFAVTLAGLGVSWWLFRIHAIDAPLSAVPLTSYPGYQLFPSFSPEGGRVVFSWDEPGKRVSNLYIKLIGAGDAVRLTNNPAGDFGPAWSPDGRFIAFLRARDSSHATVTVIPAVGGQERELSLVTCECWRVAGHWTFTVPPPFLTWSADGKWLLTLDQSGLGSGRTHAVVRISVETGEKRPVTSPPPGSYGDGSLAISPDGKRLAFTRSIGMLASDIYFIPLSENVEPEGELVRITFEGKEIDGLAWTPDGRKLVFSSSRGGRPELWETAATPHSKPIRVAAAGDDPGDVAISRQGRSLVYTHQFGDENIWRICLKGERRGESTNLISSTRNEDGARYSPDGKRIVFESNRSGSEQIWICNEDGSNPVQLTAFRKGWAGSPRWSPDGQKIAFDCNAAGNWDIYVVDSRGGNPTRLTTTNANEVRPSWSHDGKWIYYGSNQTGRYQICRMPAIGGAATQITKNGSFAAFESADGKDLYYSNISGLWRIPATGGSEIRLSESIYGDNFAAAKHGVYFIDWPQTFSTALALKLLDIRTHSTKPVTTVLAPLGDEMSVSPDEQWLLYGRMDHAGSELMIVENFH